MTLGRVIISDYSDSRVLDRLSMYERRIENSLFKTINELRRTQILREMDKQKKETEEIIEADTEQDSEILEESSYKKQDTGDSEREMDKSNLFKNEKQSQFASQRLEYMGRRVDEYMSKKIKNKANLSTEGRKY